MSDGVDKAPNAFARLWKLNEGFYVTVAPCMAPADTILKDFTERGSSLERRQCQSTKYTIRHW